jgi:hypothetical protein
LNIPTFLAFFTFFIIAPRTPEFVDSVLQDEEEEEIFFGSCSQKERSGAFAKYV